MTKSKNTGVVINSGASTTIYGDIVGGDKITYDNSKVTTSFQQSINQWQEHIERIIDETNLSPKEQEKIKKQVDEIKSAVLSDKEGKKDRIENLLNTLAVMSSDIFDVVITTLSNPLAGIGLVLRKISDKAKIESLKE